MAVAAMTRLTVNAEPPEFVGDPETPLDGPCHALAEGYAVVANSTWAAMKGRGALAIDWNHGPYANESTPSFKAHGAELLEGRGQVVRNDGNFDTYQLMRIADAPPQIETHIIDNGEAPAGMGEMGVPPLAPALANAIFHATGKRIRNLPIGDQLRA